MIVDDDPSIVKIVKLYLNKHGYASEEARDGESALARLREGGLDLAVLDLMLPRLDGWAVCRKLREEGIGTPVIMLTARSETRERIEGLRLGADDYLAKPFDPNELLARIESVLRRAARPERADAGYEAAGTLQLGDLALRPASFEASVAGRQVSLTRREFELLAYLAARPGQVHSRESLIEQLWGWDYDGEDRVVDLVVQRVRRKLGAGIGWRLTTVWGVGYKLERDAP